jgi:hypothetical protein
MDIDYAVVADHAEINGGKLYLMGGGWDNYRLPELPGQVRIAVAIGVRVGWEETNRDVPVTIRIEDDDGKTVVRLDANVNVGRPANLPPGSTQLAQLAANLGFGVESYGGFRVVVTAGSGEAAPEKTLPFRVIRT